VEDEEKINSSRIGLNVLLFPNYVCCVSTSSRPPPPFRPLPPADHPVPHPHLFLNLLLSSPTCYCTHLCTLALCKWRRYVTDAAFKAKLIPSSYNMSTKNEYTLSDSFLRRVKVVTEHEVELQPGSIIEPGCAAGFANRHFFCLYMALHRDPNAVPLFVSMLSAWPA